MKQCSHGISIYSKDQNEKKMEQTNEPVAKSYIEEFLKMNKENVVYIRQQLPDNAINWKPTEWVEGFCKELELLLESRRLLEEIGVHLKQKYK